MKSTGEDHDAPCVDTRLSFLNGEWVSHSQVSIHVEDVGFRQGVVAVERLRTYGEHLLGIQQHLDRWRETTRALAIENLPNKEQTETLLLQLLQRNLDWIDERGDVGVTMVATPGMADGSSTLLLHLNPLNHDLIATRRHSGQPIVVTEVTQPDDSCWPRGIKTRARIHYYLADREARRVDEQAVGVLLDRDGSLTETSIANFALVKSGTIISPPADRVLSGVTQSIAETLAQKASIPWRRELIHPDELRKADEVLLMGTDGGVWFAHSVDGLPISDGMPGPIYRELLRRFDEHVAVKQS